MTFTLSKAQKAVREKFFEEMRACEIAATRAIQLLADIHKMEIGKSRIDTNFLGWLEDVEGDLLEIAGKSKSLSDDLEQAS
jgi:hypothetical protein